MANHLGDGHYAYDPALPTGVALEAIDLLADAAGVDIQSDFCGAPYDGDGDPVAFNLDRLNHYAAHAAQKAREALR